MLLTSSQVSVAISSVIVFLFTTALFLSGYVVQQKTVRDIRAAIAPQPPPPMEARLYLPEQFAEHIPLPDDVAFDQAQNGNSGSIEKEESSGGNKGSGSTIHDARQKPMFIADDVQPAADVVSEEQPKVEPTLELEGKKEERKKESAAERRRRIKEEILAAGEGEGFKGYRRRMW